MGWIALANMPGILEGKLKGSFEGHLEEEREFAGSQTSQFKT